MRPSKLPRSYKVIAIFLYDKRTGEDPTWTYWKVEHGFLHLGTGNGNALDALTSQGG